MKLSPQWIREFVDIPVDNAQLAQDLTDVGAAVEGISGEGESMVFEMEITTNRPDEMNHYGIAREAAAIYGPRLKPIQGDIRTGTHAPQFQIVIEDADGCARYTAQIMRNVKITASPAHIARRLELVEQRPINNAADASNYTLWEMGHPTHAFDLDLLEGEKIIVRRARAGETLKTLDGVDRKLSPEDLVIADAGKPVALAGVMGGFDTMITEKTRNVLIESAWFDPVTVRKTAKRHGLHTDASHRFERGADFAATTLACARVAQRILESGGGELQGGAIDVVGRELDQAPVELRVSEVQRILGPSVSRETAVRILDRLGFHAIPEGSDTAEFSVHIPSWRLDVEREIDLVEEIARLHGYNKFPNTVPSFAGGVVEAPEATKRHRIRSSLLALGYNEAVSLTFISREDAKQFSTAVAEILLANPISEEASVMRTSLVPGMLNMLAYNLNRGTDRVRLFETGNVFEAAGAGAVERIRTCVGITGPVLPENAHERPRPVSFFDLKGDIETVIAAFDHEALYYDSNVSDYYHPGRSARAVMDGATVAQFGQLHPDIAAARKLRQDVFIAEMYLDRLYQHDLRQIRYEPLPRYPSVQRDFSFVFADRVTWERISNTVGALEIPELKRLVPAEIFRGGAVLAGKYSVLVRATFQSHERTLREDEVSQWSARIVQSLEALGGVLRSA